MSNILEVADEVLSRLKKGQVNYIYCGRDEWYETDNLMEKFFGISTLVEEDRVPKAVRVTIKK